VTDLVTRHGGEILYTERWPDRKLAYEIKGRKKGTYFLTYFRAAGEAISGVRRDAQLSDRILRVLIVKNERALAEIEGRKEAQQVASAAPADGSPVGAFDGDELRQEFGPEEAVAGPGGAGRQAKRARVEAEPEALNVAQEASDDVAEAPDDAAAVSEEE
jgi:ribosomal protein S6